MQLPVLKPEASSLRTCAGECWWFHRKCEYRPYQEPYTRGFRRLVNRKLETKCNPWGLKTCVRNQPEYQTVYKTFYRTVYKCAADDGH
ncbi:hypothetical protein PR048_017409 [Dryococelus australis]|uniref:Uncharacterized protein n=1 Tax=Dryococelus australis TaxID=614101 RepID=A0ABQ9H9F2_9NEOP|nr:hypothetical protein PR048_017409 [Dryococelus australis]